MNDELAWYIGSDLSEAKITVNNKDKPIKVPNKIWDQEMTIQKGDKLQFAPFNDVYLSLPEELQTFKQFLQFLNENYHSVISSSSKIAQKKIGSFYDEDFKKELTKKLKTNKLKWIDIIGDECAWAGNLKRSKKGIWSFNVDS